MDASSLISSVGSAAELARLLINERDRHKAAAIQTDLLAKLVEAQLQLSQVLGTIIEKDGRIQVLAERVRELEAEQGEKARYQLAKIGTFGDIFAYRLRASAELSERADEPPHFLCQPCFDLGKKSVLQVGEYSAICPICKTDSPIKLYQYNV